MVINDLKAGGRGRAGGAAMSGTSPVALCRGRSVDTPGEGGNLYPTPAQKARAAASLGKCVIVSPRQGGLPGRMDLSAGATWPNLAAEPHALKSGLALPCLLCLLLPFSDIAPH